MIIIKLIYQFRSALSFDKIVLGKYFPQIRLLLIDLINQSRRLHIP